MMYTRFSRLTAIEGYLAFIVVFGLYSYFIWLAFRANLDLSDGRFALHMDERIIFDGVKNIIDASNLSDFWYAVLDGNDQRYGRSLWNVSAFFSYLPGKFYSETGQIISTRIVQLLLILITVALISIVFVRPNTLKLAVAAVYLGIPFTPYYMTMPKPEPLQLFLVIVFCIFYLKNNASFGLYWFFAGLAFGTKISLLPALLVFTFYSLLSTKGKGTFKALIGFIIGLATAVPILSPALLPIAALLAFFPILNAWLGPKLSGALLIGGSILCSLTFSKDINIWLNFTFLNTGHGQDQANISFFDWSHYFFETWLNVPFFLSALLGGSISIYFLNNASYAFKSKLSKKKCICLIFAIAGLAMNLTIFLAVKRVWGFYLYTGTAIFILGLFASISVDFDANDPSQKQQILGSIIACSMLTVTLAVWLPRNSSNLDILSQRTKEPDYITKLESFHIYNSFLNNLKNQKTEQLTIGFDPLLFPPNSNKSLKFIEFWGPYTEWNKPRDLLIFSSINTPAGPPLPVNSPNYRDYLVALKGYDEHVMKETGVCLKSPCYERARKLPDGGEILVRR